MIQPQLVLAQHPQDLLPRPPTTHEPSRNNDTMMTPFMPAKAPLQYDLPTFLSPPREQRLPSLRSILSPPAQDDPTSDSYYHAHPLPAAPRPVSYASSQGPEFRPQPPRLHLGTDIEPRYYHPHDRGAPGSAAPSTSSLPPLSLPRSSASASPPLRHQNGIRPSRNLEDWNIHALGSSHATSDAVRPNTAPRYLGLRDIPGEGQCHYYDDGSYCKTTIAGEPVNPAWGVTKAGKPRKRLAQACLTCREKKIKCEPGFPRCMQCAKQGRVCKKSADQRPTPEESDVDRPSVQRNSMYDPALRNYVSADPLSATSLKRSSMYLHSPPLGNSYHSVNTNPDGVDPDISHKRPRSYSQTALQPSYRQLISPRVSRTHMTTHAESNGRAWVNNLTFSMHHDPFEVEPRLTLDLVNLFFDYSDCGLHAIFPRDQFCHWVASERNKSRDDKMLLHVVLAFGSIFGNNTDLEIVGNKLANIARNVEDERLAPHTLQLAQTRLLLAMYCSSRGHFQEASEYTATGLKALAALRLNTEEGLRDVTGDVAGSYAFSIVQLVECRRRTFWLGYLLDRYNCSGQGHQGAFADEDVYQYLPLSDEDFQAGNDRVTTLFDGGNIHVGPSMTRESEHLICLLPGANIWGKISANGSRMVHMSTNSYSARYHEFYSQTNAQLAAWESSLPTKFRFSPTNTAAAIKGGYIKTYLVLQSVYCLSGMKLNSIGRCDMHSPGDVIHKIREARRYARILLSVVSSVANSMLVKRSADMESALSQPFPSYAILFACDLVSAGGSVDALDATIRTLSDAQLVLVELGRFWHAAAGHARQVEGRQVELAGFANLRESRFWRAQGSLDVPAVRQDHDFIYGVSLALLLEALQDEGSG